METNRLRSSITGLSTAIGVENALILAGLGFFGWQRRAARFPHAASFLFRAITVDEVSFVATASSKVPLKHTECGESGERDVAQLSRFMFPESQELKQGALCIVHEVIANLPGRGAACSE